MEPSHLVTSTRRRIGQSLGAITMALPALAWRSEITPAGNRRKCKRCPQRKCCACFTDVAFVSCRYLKPDQSCPCIDQGLGSKVIDPRRGQANFCTTDNDCVKVECPIA